MMVFSLGAYSSIGVASQKYHDDDLKRYYSSIITLSLLSYTILALLTYVILSWLGVEKIIILLAAMVEGLAGMCISFANNRFIHSLKAKENFYLSLAVLLSTLITSIVLLNHLDKEINYWGRILGLICPKAIIALIILLSFWKEKSFFVFEYWKFCLYISIPIAVHNVSNLVLSQSDRVMLQGIVSDSEAGVYSLAYGFASILVTIYGALYHTWLPFYLRYAKSGDAASILRHGRNYIRVFSYLMVGFLLIYQEVFRIFADSTYWSGITIIPILLVGFFFMHLYSLSIMYELYNQKSKMMGFATFVTALCNILLNFVFIKRYGALGAAVASSTSYCIEFIIHYLYANSYIKGYYPFKIMNIFPEILIGVLGLCLFIVFHKLVFIRWILAVITGVCLIYSVKKEGSII